VSSLWVPRRGSLGCRVHPGEAICSSCGQMCDIVCSWGQYGRPGKVASKGRPCESHFTCLGSCSSRWRCCCLRRRISPDPSLRGVPMFPRYLDAVLGTSGVVVLLATVPCSLELYRATCCNHDLRLLSESGTEGIAPVAFPSLLELWCIRRRGNTCAW
jgi:hypothetical protein